MWRKSNINRVCVCTWNSLFTRKALAGNATHTRLLSCFFLLKGELHLASQKAEKIILTCQKEKEKKPYYKMCCMCFFLSFLIVWKSAIFMNNNRLASWASPPECDLIQSFLLICPAYGSFWQLWEPADLEKNVLMPILIKHVTGQEIREPASQQDTVGDLGSVD